MGWILRGSLAILAGILAARQEDPFGKPYIIKVQAKTRWSTSFRQADFDKQLKKQKDNLRFKARAEIADDLAGWDEWTFEVSENWLFDLEIIQLLYGRHIIIRRYDIEIEGVVKADARKNYLLTHPGSGKILRLHNRPKLPKDTSDPPDVRSKIVAAVKEGHKTFRVTGEIIVDGSPVVLLASAEPLDEVKK